ncbi:MAG: carbon-nitrogen hydrolase family protein [Fimbriimonadaceae bacterium]|nr:carbon-nitrogen hydrolase family protein [Fimbriimonadaceae bacterium]
MPRVAVVQDDPKFGEHVANATLVVNHLKSLKEQGVQIAVFPECFLTGYCVATAEAAHEIAITAPEPQSLYEDDADGAWYLDPCFVTVMEAVDETGIITVVGYASEDALGVLHNEAALLVPGEAPQVYRKTHLPELGYDKFVQPGSDIPVFDTPLGRIGIGICFDLRAPEMTRLLALQGADLVALPTNWPVGAEVSADTIAPARAAENKVFLVTANRCATENGFQFIGHSGIYGVGGEVIAKAGETAETLIADLDFAQARNKRTVGIPGQYETTVFESRRPELYEGLVEPTLPDVADE